MNSSGKRLPVDGLLDLPAIPATAPEESGGILRQASAGSLALALLLLIAPLPFGGVTPGAASALAIAAFVSLALALTANGRKISRLALQGAGGVAAVGLVGLLQSLSWPAWLADRVAPRIVALATDAARAVDPESGPLRWLALSLAPGASRYSAFAWMAVAAVALAAALALVRRSQRQLVAGAILVSALFQVFYGAQQWFVRADSIWGVSTGYTPNRLRGTFVNANHLALYLEIGLAIAFAWGWVAARHARAEERLERRLLAIALPVLTWLTLFAGLAFSNSRAGLGAALAATVAQGGLIALRAGSVRLGWTGLAAAGAGLVAVSWVGFRAAFGRFIGPAAESFAGNARLSALRETLELWGDFPLTGVGLGAFRAAFPLVQTESVGGLWRHAHCDWLELGATTGVLGLACFALALVAVTRAVGSAWLRGLRSEDRAAGLAAAGATVAVALHSLVDFGLTMPANSLTLAIVVAAAAVVRKAAVSPPSRDEPAVSPPSRDEPAVSPPSRDAAGVSPPSSE